MRSDDLIRLPESGNIYALGAQIIRCLDGTENVRKIAQNAKRRSRDFEVSKIASRLVEYYETVISRKSANI